MESSGLLLAWLGAGRVLWCLIRPGVIFEGDGGYGSGLYNRALRYSDANHRFSDCLMFFARCTRYTTVLGSVLTLLSCALPHDCTLLH